MMQRPIIPDLSKVMVAGSSDMTQREDTNFHPENVPIDHPMFGPRSIGPRMGPEVDFPPAFPNKGNLEDICQFSKTPVRYPKDMFPQDGFGHEYRQADAINKLQSWYGVCCGIYGTQEEQICCAEQAWKKSLAAYCFQEFTIKTSHYFCCKKSRKARWSCFDKEASGFPPGRPDSSNIAHICAHHKIRPRYMPKCLPRTGYGWLIRQSKAINVLEREYNQCCEEKKGEHSSAVLKRR
ncbi:extracellular matrix protein 1-like [Sinocyclocheilus grahami]|uniref:extracellular matrix protein 1-like n=1 Tax=Sinocyclocheilus grahami TaxID=75366 RepID=UPI0007AD1A99|nr:PREDICTED: extracellular matrix protein 1-like [Sinocyclocheilus grahami]